jgi:hypothetical protein
VVVQPVAAVKRRLGEVAAALSRAGRRNRDGARRALAGLRRYLATNIRSPRRRRADHVPRRPCWPRSDGAAPGGGDVHFADVQIAIESDGRGRAYLRWKSRASTARAVIDVDARDASVSLARRNGEWVITPRSRRRSGPARIRDHPADEP